MVTDPQTHIHTHKQNRLQYTVLQLAHNVKSNIFSSCERTVRIDVESAKIQQLLLTYDPSLHDVSGQVFTLYLHNTHTHTHTHRRITHHALTQRTHHSLTVVVTSSTNSSFSFLSHLSLWSATISSALSPPCVNQEPMLPSHQ